LFLDLGEEARFFLPVPDVDARDQPRCERPQTTSAREQIGVTPGRGAV
jgi:hypothetical protein